MTNYLNNRRIATKAHMIQDFMDVNPRVSWSPFIAIRPSNINFVYLLMDTFMVEGRGRRLETAKVDAITRFYSFAPPYDDTGEAEEIISLNNLVDNKPKLINIMDCFENDTSSKLFSRAKAADYVDFLFDFDTSQMVYDFNIAYQHLSYWSNLDYKLSDGNYLKVALNIGDYRFIGFGLTLEKAKINTIKRFYLSSVQNFFEICQEYNEQTETERDFDWEKEDSVIVLEDKSLNDAGNSSPTNTNSSENNSEPQPAQPREIRRNDYTNKKSLTLNFLEKYNLRNSIWSPFARASDDPNKKSKSVRVILRLGPKQQYEGQGKKKSIAKINAIKKLKRAILQANPNCTKTKFIENINKLGIPMNNGS
ncbi:hypothetical protein AGLY_016357 [Aphis glycines]|uniref:Uncharacterized protein n=1 Tax=Aphis glycines TaxID=307491 RepID=A0A6G0T027_APHGL|nr:hypothetical protein AGLY_016357 [Aphis glycines]